MDGIISYDMAEMLSKPRDRDGILKSTDVKDYFYPDKPCFYDSDGVTLYNHSGSEYFIGWDQLDTPLKAILFVDHLCDKIWINRKNIQFLIEACGMKFNWGYLAINKNSD